MPMHLKWMIVLLLLCFSGFAQKKSIDKLLDTYNTRSVPYISVEELRMNQDDYIILDSRKQEEYDVSHLPNAIWVGDHFDENLLTPISKTNKKIVVYCSVGVRSEDFGEKLQNRTSKSVSNLYGGIFAWKDAGFPILDAENRPTQRVHTFSKNWQDYLKTGIAVY
ncbi:MULTISPECIES: rhodanese-like domain-containing protein [unclassified Leeuwenhoekiella]|uniref:rhodanese-like domain-containing protein n=1 Tax=unclassified Leeuwenhoekiella TaxID=2615029 RepID=UPI0026CF179D